uniref:TIGR02453 family protein n=1 Tax=Rhodotorula toruloides TaxID=5286 RepID=A0A0K3C8E5_RHOTO
MAVTASRPRRSSIDTPPKKKARRVAPPESSASEDEEDASASGAGSSEDDEVKEEDKPKAKGKKRKAKDESDEDEYSGKDATESEEDDYDSDESGGLNRRVVRTVKKVAGPDTKADTHVVLPTTLEFLADLAKHNDREWFQQNDARYRHAFLNFKTLVTAWVPVASEADWTLPHLPAKDLMHRIYRDVRFSKDKTPYKRYLCASHSRTGRKGPFALYYLHIQPGGRSFVGCGCWSPQADVLKLIRNAILRDPKPLRKVLAEKEFVKLFGSDKPRLDGKRGGIFNADDQLKNAPKLEGVDKTHKDIDLLKCRSFAVETYFPDDVVLADDFLQTVKHAMETAAPFVQLLNEIISPSPPSDNDDGDDDDEQGSGSAEEEESE